MDVVVNISLAPLAWRHKDTALPPKYLVRICNTSTKASTASSKLLSCTAICIMNSVTGGKPKEFEKNNVTTTHPQEFHPLFISQFRYLKISVIWWNSRCTAWSGVGIPHGIKTKCLLVKIEVCFKHGNRLRILPMFLFFQYLNNVVFSIRRL